LLLLLRLLWHVASYPVLPLLPLLLRENVLLLMLLLLQVGRFFLLLLLPRTARQLLEHSTDMYQVELPCMLLIQLL
jgi:hypothetical protein